MRFRMQTPSNSISTPTNHSSDRKSASTAGQTQRKRMGLIGVVLMVVSESIFFLAAFWGYFYTRVIALEWPPAGVGQPQINIALANTAIAILSTVAVYIAERAIARDNRRLLIQGIAVAGALGTIFMAVQSVEFVEINRLAQGSNYGSMFVALLVFHVSRVFIGVALMALVLIRASLGQFSAQRRLLVQATAIYWYFITIVWLVVFYVLFILV